MKSFNDNTAKTWTISINTTSIKRVRDLMGVDLLSILDDGNLLEQLYDDPILLVDLVYCLCKPKSDEDGVTSEQFGESMAGDAIEHATTALLEDLCDFFPRGRRELLHKAMTKLDQLEARAIQHATTKLDSPELDRKLTKMLSEQKMPGD